MSCEKSEFKKKHNVRVAPCCRICQMFIFEKEIEVPVAGSELIIGPEKRKILVGDCKVAMVMGDSVKTSSDAICDCYISWSEG